MLLTVKSVFPTEHGSCTAKTCLYDPRSRSSEEGSQRRSEEIQGIRQIPRRPPESRLPGKRRIQKATP